MSVWSRRDEGKGVVRLRWLTLLLLLLLSVPGAASAAVPSLEELFGSYTGYAEVVDLVTGERERREMDVVIERYQRRGFRVRWTNVSLVDGRRDVPGVKRREMAVAFKPAPDGSYFVEAPEYNPFRRKEEIQPLEGDPIRWAVLDDSGLYIYSFVVLLDGRYELQMYRRFPEREGIGLLYERILDGTVVKRITGYAVRTE